MGLEKKEKKIANCKNNFLKGIMEICDWIIFIFFLNVYENLFFPHFTS